MTPGPGRAGFGTAVWSCDEWRAEAVDWLDRQLAAAGVSRTGEVEHPHVRAWATAMAVPTDHGRYWMKAAGPDTAFEVPLYAVLTDLVPDHVLRPLAADPDRGWIVLPDGGPVLADRLAGADLGRALGRAAVQYGRVQRDLMVGERRMLAAGVPDMRPAAMLGAFDRAVALTEPDAAGDADRADRYRAVAAAREAVARWCTDLTRSVLPASLDHNDLHPRNIFWPDGGAGAPVRFFDWGDSVLAHPFAAMLVPLDIVRRLLGTALDAPDFVAVRDRYLGLFSDLAPGEDLVATLETACRVAKIARAHTWLRAIGAAAEQGDEVARRFRHAPVDTLAAILDEDYLTVG